MFLDFLLMFQFVDPCSWVPCAYSFLVAFLNNSNDVTWQFSQSFSMFRYLAYLVQLVMHEGDSSRDICKAYDDLFKLHVTVKVSLACIASEVLDGKSRIIT